MTVTTDQQARRCGKRWAGTTMFQCICARPADHDDDHECVCGETMAAVRVVTIEGAESFVDGVRERLEADDNITGTMVSPEKAKPAHDLPVSLVKHPQNLPSHPAVREMIERLSDIPGITSLSVTEEHFTTRTKVYIEVWLTNGR